MTNANCLEGMQCPECASPEPLIIEVTTFMSVFDSGTDDHGDVHWEDDSYCECRSCGHAGTVGGFTVTGESVLALTR